MAGIESVKVSFKGQDKSQRPMIRKGFAGVENYNIQEIRFHL